MIWPFHRHDWILHGIWNNPEPQGEIGSYHYVSYWMFTCRVCNKHRLRTFRGHWALPGRTQGAVDQEFLKAMRIKSDDQA